MVQYVKDCISLQCTDITVSEQDCDVTGSSSASMCWCKHLLVDVTKRVCDRLSESIWKPGDKKYSMTGTRDISTYKLSDYFKCLSCDETYDCKRKTSDMVS